MILSTRNFLVSSTKILKMISRLTYRTLRPMMARSMSTNLSSSSAMLAAMANIRASLGSRSNAISAPCYAVVGNQSSGKSSVLTAITGVSVFPTGQDEMVTRRPLRITLLDGPYFEAQFGVSGTRITRLEHMQNELADRNAGRLCSDVVDLTLRVPGSLPMTVVDLPGYVATGGDDYSPEEIVEMNRAFVEDDSYIKLIVMAAPSDMAVSMGLQAVKAADQLSNSIGVITKIDMVRPQKLQNMIEHPKWMPGLGRYGVFLRDNESVERGVTVDQHIDVEKEFIGHHKLPVHLCGVPVLRERLSSVQLSRTLNTIPKTIEEAREAATREKRSHNMLTMLNEQTDLSRISDSVGQMVNDLHPLSPSRSDFEVEMRATIGRVVEDTVQHALAQLAPLQPIEKDNREGSIAPLNDSDIFALAAAKSYESKIPKDWDNHDQRVGILGASFSEDYANRQDFRDGARTRIVQAVHVLSHQFELPRHVTRACVNWNRRLGRLMELLIEEHDLGETARHAVIESLMAYVRKNRATVHGATKQEEELSSMFFEYIMERIAQRTDHEELARSIRQMVMRESRAVPDFPAMAEHLSGGRVPHSSVGVFFSGTVEHGYPKRYPIFGPEWDKAYVHGALKQRMSDDIYRMVAVNLLDPIISRAIEFSLRFFQRRDFKSEEERTRARIEAIESDIAVLRAIYEERKDPDSEEPFEIVTE